MRRPNRRSVAIVLLGLVLLIYGAALLLNRGDRHHREVEFGSSPGPIVTP
jgi:hypothetical protein